MYPVIILSLGVRRVLVRLLVVGLIFGPFAGSWCPAQIISHLDIDAVPAWPQATMDVVGQQKWFFAHASVGGNMMNGMSNLHATNPTRYKLGQASVGYDSGTMRANNPPSPTVVGTIYECQRGNPGWQAKITIFQNSVNTSGWRSSATPIVMDKLCYVDQDAGSAQYVAAMAGLEASWPTTIFVYMTMPLTTGEDYSNVQRNVYNTAVRQFCQTNGRLLYDIADMEAFDPAGVQQTFLYGGQTYQKMYAGYSSDGGHLNSTGCERVALGWYAVAAALAAAPDCNLNGVPDNLDIARGTSADTNGNGVPDECEFGGDVNCDGAINGADVAAFVLALLDPEGYAGAYPGCDRMSADCDGNGWVNSADVGPFVSRVIGG
jgi:hypothetical protein